MRSGCTSARERRRAEDRQLRARVVALHVVGGIGLGVAELLRLPQRVAESRAAVRHAREDVVARAVEDARARARCDRRRGRPERGDDRDAAGDRALEAQVAAAARGHARAAPPPRCAISCLFAVTTDLPRVERALHPRARGVDAADQLDDDVRGGRRGRRRCRRSSGRSREPSRRACGATPRLKMCVSSHAGRRLLAEDARHRAADGAEPEERDAAGRARRRIGRGWKRSVAMA